MGDPLRVVFADHSSEPGGAELALLRLLRTDQSWVATAVVPPSAGSGGDAFTDVPDSVRIRRSGPTHVARRTQGTSAAATVAFAFRLLRSALSLWRMPEVREADVLVANTTRASVYCTVAGALARTPVVVHIRDLIEPEAIGGSATWLMRRLVLPRAAGVIANSSASMKTTLPFLASDVLSAVIPSPAGIRRVEPSSVEVEPTVRRIGLVARIDPWKGQELLLRAFAATAPEHDATLVLYGGASFGHDDFAKQLRSTAAALGIADRVQLAGHVADVGNAIDSLDICVQCSLRPEPLGQNVLQYLAAGKPTIVANEGGPAEWVVDGVNGLTFRSGDADDLAAQLRRLIHGQELRHRLARQAVMTPGLADDSEVGRRIFGILSSVGSR